MSGHNKWSTIKRKKGAMDAKRSKLFSRISKEISIAIKEGGGSDPEFNPRLRLALQNAKGANMPKDNIQRIINKAESDDTHFEEITFEGYGPGGVGVFVECLTDNHLRTVSSIRATFSKRGGTLDKNGSLSFLFERKGVFVVKKEGIDLEEFELEVIDAGAEDFSDLGDELQIITAMEDFGNMQKKLDELGVEVVNAELQRLPTSYKEVDIETAKKLLKLVEVFEDDDDVQNVYHNLEMTEEVEKALEEE